MTSTNSIQELKVTEDELKEIESFSMSLMSLSESYKLPDAVNQVIEDMADKIETVRMNSVLKFHHPELKLVNS